MLRNIVPYVSVLERKDEELTELEKKNKQLLLQNKNKEDSSFQTIQKKINDTKSEDNKYLKNKNEIIITNKNEVNENTKKQENIKKSENMKENENKHQYKQDIQNRKLIEQDKFERESTENDYILAQLLQSEINNSPIKEQPKNNLIRRDSQREQDNINLPQKQQLSERDKRFLMRQKQEFELYKQQKEELQQIQNQQNNQQLIEVNDDFINNVFNMQYPTNKKILEEIKKKEEEKANKIKLQQQQQHNIVQKNNQRFFQNPVVENIPEIPFMDNIKWCSLCGEYQRQSQFERHQSECRMSNIFCQFCEKTYPRQIIDSHMVSCLRREENKLLDLYQQMFSQEGIPINQTHQIFFGSRQQMRREYNIRNYEQQKEIERLIIQNQRKIQKSYQNKTSKSQYYADVQYVKDSSSQQAEDCCICFQTFIEKETLGMLPCAHKFHTNCIDDWIKVKKLCPLCKRGF